MHTHTPALVPLLRNVDEVVLSSDLARVGLGGDLQGWGGWVQDALSGAGVEEGEEADGMTGLGGVEWGMFWWGKRGRERGGR